MQGLSELPMEELTCYYCMDFKWFIHPAYIRKLTHGLYCPKCAHHQPDTYEALASKYDE